MSTKTILRVDTLKNLVAWIGRNFVRESRPTNARILYLSANEPGTPVDYDCFDVFSKFNSENFFPENITKDEKSNFKNYPTIKKVANMKSYDDIKVKENLTKLWGKVNG